MQLLLVPEMETDHERKEGYTIKTIKLNSTDYMKVISRDKVEGLEICFKQRHKQ